MDVLTALQRYNIVPEEHGISILKIGCAFPLEADKVQKFCFDHSGGFSNPSALGILVVEEKTPFVEDQLYKMLYKKVK